MVKDFQEIILTNKNLEYKKNYNKNSERKSMRGKTPLPDLLKDEPDRVGFIFVIDSNASEKIYSDVRLQLKLNIFLIDRGNNTKITKC
jgi:hypothetical protein